MKRRLTILAAVVALVLAFGFVGTADFEEAERQADEYCHNVKNGVWPDYQGTYKKYCENVEKELDDRNRSK